MEQLFNKQQLSWKLAAGYGGAATALMFVLGLIVVLTAPHETQDSLFELCAMLSLTLAGTFIGRRFKIKYGAVQFFAEKQIAAACIIPWLIEVTIDVLLQSSLTLLWVIFTVILTFGRMFIFMYLGALIGSMTVREPHSKAESESN